MDQDSIDLLTVEELAVTLKVPKSWIYARTREKGAAAIPQIRAGKYIRFEREQVMEWLRERSTSCG